MSHAVTITFEINTDTERGEINDLRQSLLNLQSVVHSQLVANCINDLLEQLQKVEDQLIAISGLHTETGSRNSIDQKFLEYERQKSHLLKTVQNLQIDVSYEELINENNQIIHNLIIENGFLSKIVIDQLESQGLNINPENFLSVLNEVKQANIDQEKYNNLKTSLTEMLMKQNVDHKLKGTLLNEFMMMQNYQELADFAAYVKEVVNNYNEALKKQKIYEHIFAKHNYKPRKLEFIIKKDDENKLRPTFAFIADFVNQKQHNNILKLTLNLDGTVSYDIGDYERHMCWNLAENVQQDLLAYNYKYAKQTLTRNASNARPLARAMKQKTGNNNA
ncbi:hypothetical protein OF377_01435 [Ureaplasma sp. ES3154-GEN]|uniref:hypothetical protein n=1 Tax=Ureaplasma sp. ES3154-GEN TaxID=2984844 RepID=UPI0021E95440|nr:hypothetical protein [Ureaplasma sp. ES3154-GEN]MCV3743549.1 hypothetical protein [Ureaplasma sp. ES3154-GEN]